MEQGTDLQLQAFRPGGRKKPFDWRPTSKSQGRKRTGHKIKEEKAEGKDHRLTEN